MIYPIVPVPKPCQRKHWSASELAWLREHYPQRGKNSSAEFLGRTWKAVAQKACDLGLKQDRSSPFFAEWQARAAAAKVGRKRPEQAAVIKASWASGKIRRTAQQLSEFRGRVTDDYWYQRTLKSHASRQKNGTHTGHGDQRGQYGSGWRVLAGTRIFFRSRWEANYARWLELLRTQGKIQRWEHEPETFWFTGIKRGTLSYLPDFRVTRADGSVEYHEVKGWMTPRSKTAIQRMAKYHPQVKLLVVDQKQYARLAKDVGALVQGWEQMKAANAFQDACRVCGCTEDDCSQCVAKTGEPCSWIAPGLCSACEVGDVISDDARDGFGGAALDRATPLAQARCEAADVGPSSQRKANQMARTTRSKKPAAAKAKKTKGRSAASKGAAKPRSRPAKPRKVRGAAASSDDS